MNLVIDCTDNLLLHFSFKGDAVHTRMCPAMTQVQLYTTVHSMSLCFIAAPGHVFHLGEWYSEKENYLREIRW